MTMPLRSFDRISRKWDEFGAGDTLLSGEVILDGPLVIDRQENKSSILLVDNGDGTTLIEGIQKPINQEIFQGTRRDSLRACSELGQRIRDLEQQNYTWLEIIERVDPIILIKDIDVLLNVDQVELSLSNNKQQLRGAFYAPSTELEFQTIRLPAGRARRISRRATQVLAAHSEDWLKRSGANIIPSKIESLEKNEIINIYENRVAARLIDAVRIHLVQLRNEIEKVEELIEGNLNVHYQFKRRLSELWGNQQPSDKLRDVITRRRKDLDSKVLFIDGLRDKSLYKGVPRRASVAQPARMTNLLENDLNYRGVRNLWIEWWKIRGSLETPQDRRRQRVTEAESFFLVCRLVIGRALRGLKLELLAIEQCDEFDSGCWRLSDTKHIVSTELFSVLVVALPCELQEGSNNEIRKRIEVLRLKAASSSNDPFIILYPGTSSDFGSDETPINFPSLLNPLLDFSSARQLNVWLIPISPLDLKSIERVQRAIRWITMVRSFHEYPPKFQTSEIGKLVFTGEGFRGNNASGTEICLVEHPVERELSAIRPELEHIINGLKTKQRGAGRAEIKILENTLVDFEKACTFISRLQKCPTCPAEGKLNARGAKTFEAQCESCSSRWGLRHDAISDHRVAYLWIGESVEEIPKGSKIADWVGRDILAVPCQSDSAEYGKEVINPWTGTCTGKSQLASRCERCGNLSSVT